MADQRSSKKKPDTRTCFHCEQVGHIASNCPEKKKQRICFNCNKPGHIKRECPQLNKEVLPQHHVSFIDTHCHLEYVFERAGHRESFQKFLEKFNYPDTFAACISTFCDPAAFSSLGLWTSLLEEDKVYGSFGVHPHHAKYYNEDLEAKVLSALSHPKCVAYGEIGLDYSDHSPSPRDIQKQVFRKQLNLAVESKKPLVLHCRDAEDDMKEILLSSSIPSETPVHLHCCTCSPNVVRDLLEKFPNLYVGVTANVYYHSTKDSVQETVCMVPLNRLLLETDSPYLCPPNMWQKWNHPVKILEVGVRVATLTKLSLEDILKQTTENAKELYKIETKK